MSKTYLIILCLFLSSPTAWSNFNKLEIPSNKKPIEVSLQSEVFRTQANYTQWGQYVDLPDKNFFQFLLFRPQISYSPFKHYVKLSVFMNNYSASSETNNKLYALPFKPTTLGGKVRFYHKIQSLFIGLELMGGYPLYSNFESTNTPVATGVPQRSSNPNEIVVGDGAAFGESALLFLFKPSSTFYIYNRNSFRYRSSGLSSLVFSSLGGAIDSKYLSVGFGLNAFLSIFVLDQNIQRLQRLQTANAGSYKFYSVNPSVIYSTMWLDFKYNTFKGTLYCSLDTLGQNYGKGLTFGFITKVRWFTQSNSNYLEKKKSKNPYFDFGQWKSSKPTPTKKLKSSFFEEETDPYDNRDNQDSSINFELKQELNLLKE